ncbi:diguanylate cyclase (GGDEF)-like protein [Pseudomonas graminis]|nr:diguanylate cyclase (GGDEF)-like protein [Pseudomonas graminis]
MRDGDIAVRHGGDEFVLLLALRAGESLSSVQRAAERVIAKLAEPMTLSGEVIKVSCSIGGAVWTGGAFTDVLAHADEALYQAKRVGKAQAQFYDIAGLSPVSDA